MSNPIYSTDLYSPGNQDTLVLLKKQLEDIQVLMDKLQAEAKQLKLSLAGAGTSPSKVVAAATEAQRINNEKQRLAVKQQLALDKMRQVSAAQTATQIVRSEQQQQREMEKTRQQMLRTQITANNLAKSKIQLANASKRTGSSFTGLLGSIRNLAVAYFSLGAAAQVFQSILKQTKALDTLTVAFNTTLGSTQATAQAQEYLLDISERFGANLLGASQAYLKFSAASTQAGVSAEETQKIFTSVTKASSILGLGAERTSYVFLALEQIMSKGRLSTEELRRQLGEHLPGAFGIAAEAMGVTTAKLTDMLKKGEIASTDFLPKFAVQLEKAYGIDQVERIDNLAAAQERFNNELTLLVKEVDLSETFKDFFNSLAAGLRYVRENADAFLKLGEAIIYVAAAWAGWKIGAAVTAMGSLRKAMIALNAAMAANPAGIVIVAIVALVGAVDLLTNKVDGLTIAKKAYNDAAADGASSTKLLEVQTRDLIKAYNDENTSTEQKAKILKTLNSLGFEAIDIDGDKVISTDEVTAAVKRQIAALQLLAQTQRLEREFNDIEARKAALGGKKTLNDSGFSIASGIDAFFGTTITTVGKNRVLGELDIAQKEIEAKLRELYKAAIEGGGVALPDAFAKDPENDGDGKGKKEQDPRIVAIDRLIELNKLEEDSLDKKIAAVTLAYQKEKVIHENDTEYILALKEQFYRDLFQVETEFYQEEIEGYERSEEQKKAAFKKATEDVKAYLDERRKAIEATENKRKANVDALRDEFDARRKHEEEIFDLAKHSEEEIADFKLKLKIDELNDEIQLHRIFGKVLSDEELARAIELRDKMQAALDLPNTAGLDNKDEETDIFSLLNINFDSPEQKEALIDALDFAKSQLTDFLSFQKEIIDQEIENADRKVAAAENNLSRQIALQAANQANNVAGAQAELALAKKTQEDALKQRQKFQKTELALNTALEASNLGVAIAKTLAAGLGLAGIGLVALMLGAFAAAKIKAFQLVNKKTFRKGGFKEIGGGSHESGNDTHVGGNNWAEKDESVGIFTAKATRKYKPSLKAIVNAANKGTLENILVQDRRAIQGINMTNRLDVDTSLMEKRLTRLVSLSETKTFVDGRGRLVRIDRGRTTIINR